MRVGGPTGEHVWQFVAYGSEAFGAGAVDLTLPAAGKYRFFIQAMACDGATLGEFASHEGSLRIP